MLKCPDCDVGLVGHTCPYCGTVWEEYLIFGEYSESGTEENKPKDFITPFGPDISYETKTYEKASNPELNRALKRDYMSNGKSKKGQYYALYVDIKRICSMMKLSDNIFLESMNIYNRVIDNNLLMSVGRYPAAAASILIAARMNRMPISINIISEYTTESKDKIRYAFLTIIKELNLKIIPLRLRDYVIYYGNKFNISHEDLNLALEISNELIACLNIDGKKLSGYAVAILKEILNLTANDIKEKIKISNPTIYSRHKEVRKILYGR